MNDSDTELMGSGNPSTEQRASKDGDIRLADSVNIGFNRYIGVSIGANAVVGAGAVVNEDLPDRCIAAGLPAKIFRQR